MNLLDNKRMQKILLAQKVGKYLDGQHRPADRQAVEDVALILANDVSTQVRATLAYALRHTKHLSKALAEKLAKDVEEVSSDFLAETSVFTDDHLFQLIPVLEEHARSVLARRVDLGQQSVLALAQSGGETSALHLVLNKSARLTETGARAIASRFQRDRQLLDALSGRIDLPLSIVKDIIDHVSDRCRIDLISRYKIAPSIADLVTGVAKEESLWDRLNKSSPAQIHELAIDMKRSGKMDFSEVLLMAEKGSLTFLESALSVITAYTLQNVREILSLSNPKSFMAMVKKVGINQEDGLRVLKLAKRHYSKLAS